MGSGRRVGQVVNSGSLAYPPPPPPAPAGAPLSPREVATQSSVFWDSWTTCDCFTDSPAWELGCLSPKLSALLVLHLQGGRFSDYPGDVIDNLAHSQPAATSLSLFSTLTAPL